jgi:hypothetical protein
MRVPGRFRGDLAFDECTSAQQLEGALSFGGEVGGGDRPTGHEDPGSHANFHLAGDFEGNQGFPHRRTGNPELGGKLAFGGQSLTLGKLARRNQPRDLIGYLTIKALVLDGLQRHAPHASRVRRSGAVGGRRRAPKSLSSSVWVGHIRPSQCKATGHWSEYQVA